MFQFEGKTNIQDNRPVFRVSSPASVSYNYCYICRMEITGELIDKLSHLARLKTNPEEKEVLRSDMQQIIGFIEKLSELDTTGIRPLMHLTDEINQLRDDNIRSVLTTKEGLLNAHLKDDSYFLVPKVIKKERS